MVIRWYAPSFDTRKTRTIGWKRRCLNFRSRRWISADKVKVHFTFDRAPTPARRELHRVSFLTYGRGLRLVFARLVAVTRCSPPFSCTSRSVFSRT